MSRRITSCSGPDTHASADCMEKKGPGTAAATAPCIVETKEACVRTTGDYLLENAGGGRS